MGGAITLNADRVRFTSSAVQEAHLSRTVASTVLPSSKAHAEPSERQRYSELRETRSILTVDFDLLATGRTVHETARAETNGVLGVGDGYATGSFLVVGSEVSGYEREALC